MKLSNRLQAICDLVDEGSSIIDVGCDHALIDIYLVMQKGVKAIAADVNKNALAIAEKNIKKYKLDGKIETVLTDGVNGLDIKDKTIVICGMGSQTIMDIIEQIHEYSMKDIIIQTNHDIETLRRFLVKKGFSFIDEVYLTERNKHYVLMKLIPVKKKYSDIDYIIGPIIKNKYPEYILKYLNNMQSILDKVPKYDSKRRIELESKIEQIQKELL